jgi:endonuclease/exonuclease/phosphatase (EEP) superfamily protein YafD
VHKNSIKNSPFKIYLQKLVDENSIDILLFQEANFRDNQKYEISNFSFVAAANLEYRGKFYGVLSASRVESISNEAFLTRGKEVFLGTYKSFLLTLYPLRDGRRLLVINIHAINFRESQQYNTEMSRLTQLLKRNRGPMIIAGDFNSWSRERIDRLYRAKDELKLKVVSFRDNDKDKIKSFMGNPLDHIFYRGLNLIDSTIIEQKDFSDHNPLLAQFSIKNGKNSI